MFLSRRDRQAEYFDAESLLDLGGGDGFLSRILSLSATRRGWDWQVINFDLRPQALNLAASTDNVAGSALALPFRDASVDVVIASQMTHHFEDGEVLLHLREAWRVARVAVFFSDLHRNAALYSMLWFVLRMGGYPRSFYLDALQSVRRSWRVPELQQLASGAGLVGVQVRLHFGARVLLQARKQRCSPCGAPESS
jgi:2-polyprenyl-3-methyl-5-hydroxy-6-metoxy-1,4-benzoquinol methylase